MSVNVLAQIDAPHFNCGIVLRDNVVVEAAPIVQYMRQQKWTTAQVRSYCANKGWRVRVVNSEYVDGTIAEHR